jgi:DNA modification methylase
MHAKCASANKAGCKPEGTVLDPFSGSGTTGLAAGKHGRRYVGIDLNRDYLDMSLHTRLAQTALIEDVTA